MKSLKGEKEFHQFMKLPIEIQRMILELVLVDFGHKPREYELVNYLALFRTTNYLYRQSKLVFYGQESFIISNSWDFDHWDAFEPGTAFSLNIRHLTLYIDLAFTGTDLPYVLERIKDYPELRTLRLVLHSLYHYGGHVEELQQLRSLTPERPSRLHTIVVDVQEGAGILSWDKFPFEMRQILCTILKIV